MLAISENGEVFTWGNSSYGKLGHSFAKELIVPTKRKINTKNYLN